MLSTISFICWITIASTQLKHIGHHVFLGACAWRAESYDLPATFLPHADHMLEFTWIAFHADILVYVSTWYVEGTMPVSIILTSPQHIQKNRAKWFCIGYPCCLNLDGQDCSPRRKLQWGIGVKLNSSTCRPPNKAHQKGAITSYINIWDLWTQGSRKHLT